MPISELRLVNRCAEYCDINEITHIPRNTRGIYVLYKKSRKPSQGGREKWKDKYDVVYIGMARGAKSGVHGRLASHRRLKKGEWTHFSVFEVWDNIREDEVVELEGLFRHIYRKDTRANPLNEHKAFKKLKKVGKPLDKWKRALADD
jgi:hypothetical protein